MPRTGRPSILTPIQIEAIIPRLGIESDKTIALDYDVSRHVIQLLRIKQGTASFGVWMSHRCAICGVRQFTADSCPRNQSGSSAHQAALAVRSGAASSLVEAAEAWQIAQPTAWTAWQRLLRHHAALVRQRTAEIVQLMREAP